MLAINTRGGGKVYHSSIDVQRLCLANCQAKMSPCDGSQKGAASGSECGEVYASGDRRQSGGGARPALSEAVAFAVHLQDVNAVSETVQQSADQSLRAEDLGPLVEGQVGGDQDRPSFVSLAEDLEEELRAGLG